MEYLAPQKSSEATGSDVLGSNGQPNTRGCVQAPDQESPYLDENLMARLQIAKRSLDAEKSAATPRLKWLPSLRLRAKIVLMGAEGMTNTDFALISAKHASGCPMAEPSGDVVRHYRTQSDPERNFPQRQAPGFQDRQFVKEYNFHGKPFAWHATADSILGKMKRVCKTISETDH